MTAVTVERATQRTRRPFYGWVIVLGGVILQTLAGALMNSSFGAYVALLQHDFGWSRTVFSAAFSVREVVQGLIGPLQGTLIDRFGTRANLRVGLVIFGAGFMLFSRIDSIAGFYTAFFIMAFGMAIGGYLPMAAAVVNWFVRRRATAMGLMSTGMGFGGWLAPAVAWAMHEYGWRPVAFTSGLLIMLVGLPIAQFIHFRPEPRGYQPDGDPLPTAPPALAATRHHRPTHDGDFTVWEALRTPAYWLIACGHASALLVVSAVMVHVVVHLEESLGYSITRGTAVMGLVTTMSMVGQVSGGYLGDRFDKRWMVIGCMFAHAIALLLLAYATNGLMVIAFAVLHGLAWGMRGPQMQALRADFFGRTHFGKIYGFSAPVIMVGMVAGPMIAGVMGDHFGNYRAGFTVLATLAALGSLFWVALRRPERRRPPTATAHGPSATS